MDAGGYALTLMFGGIIARPGCAAVENGTHPSAPGGRAAGGSNHAAAALLDDVSLLHELRGHRRRASSRGGSPRLERLGDSVLIVGDQATLKVHVHTDDPDAATALFSPHGTISHLDMDDMRAQMEQREERLSGASPWSATRSR